VVRPRIQIQIENAIPELDLQDIDVENTFSIGQKSSFEQCSCTKEFFPSLENRALRFVAWPVCCLAATVTVGDCWIW